MKSFVRCILCFIVFTAMITSSIAQKVNTSWPNGQPREQGALKTGLKAGKWQEFYESGKLKCKGKYKKGKFGLYDGELNGFYENGKRWFRIIYSSEARTEIAEEWEESGKLLRRVKTDYLLKPVFAFKMTTVSGMDTSVVDMSRFVIKWTNEMSDGKKLFFDFRSVPGVIKKERPREVIKTLLFDVSQINSQALLNRLDLFYDKLNWEGKVSVKSIANNLLSDTTYIDNAPRYFFEYVFMSDTLAYSKTVMDNKTYYIFPASYEKIIFDKMLLKQNKEYTEKYPDFIELPASFPDGTWLFLYSKDKEQFRQDGYGFLRRRVNDTSYQYGNYNIVYFSQEYKMHKANGAYNTYYFFSDPSEYLNDKLPVRVDKYKPLQFNIPEQYGLYKDGGKDGVFYRFLLDGKTEHTCMTFKNNTWDGILIFYYYDYNTLMHLQPPFMHYTEFNSYSDSLKAVDIAHPAWGYYKRHVFSIDNYHDKYGNKGNYVSLKESFITHAPIGIDLEIEDTITNLQSVVAKDKAKCKYYSEIYHDENGTITKWQIYCYGKLKRYGICKPSPVWTQDPEKIKSEEYDDDGDLTERTTFDYKNKTVTIAIYKKGKLVKVEKGPM